MSEYNTGHGHVTPLSPKPEPRVCMCCGTSVKLGETCPHCKWIVVYENSLAPPSRSVCKGSVYLGTGCMECDRCRVASGNLEKLYDRQRRGKLAGSGDNR